MKKKTGLFKHEFFGEIMSQQRQLFVDIILQVVMKNGKVTG